MLARPLHLSPQFGQTGKRVWRSLPQCTHTTRPAHNLEYLDCICCCDLNACFRWLVNWTVDTCDLNTKFSDPFRITVNKNAAICNGSWNSLPAAPDCGHKC